MEQEFDEPYWQGHWEGTPLRGAADGALPAPNPHLVAETRDLRPGTALDAGCGEGDEARWLAAQGWQVTATDISAEALGRAAAHAGTDATQPAIRWVEADLTVWDPGVQFDLVTTHYAHPTLPQLAFYDRLCGWVAPGGTLLIVGHLHGAGHGHGSPEAASVTVSAVTANLAASTWEVITAAERVRTMTASDGRSVRLDDVVVRALRRSST